MGDSDMKIRERITFLSCMARVLFQCFLLFFSVFTFKKDAAHIGIGRGLISFSCSVFGIQFALLMESVANVWTR